MANPSLQIGNSNWAIKEDNLLGYSTAGTRFVPQPITMTRESAGTRVNSSGLVETVELLGSELVDLTTGSTLDGSSWVSITESGVTYLAGGNNPSYYDTGFTVTSGLTYKLTFTISNYSGTSTLGFSTTGGVSSSARLSADGSYTEYFTAASSVELRIFGLNTNTGIFSNISVKESTKNNLARVDYDGTASSLLVEPERTNLLPYSSDFSSWTSGTSYVTSDYSISPDGTQNASRCLFTNSNQSLSIPTSLGTSVEANGSIYIKGNSGETIQIAVGGVDKLITLTNDWQRYDATKTSVNSQFNVNTWGSTTARDFQIWGAQLEQGSYPTSYIPTDGSTVTRVQDQYSKTGISNLINSEEGVLFGEIAALSDDGTYRLISLEDNSDSSTFAYLGYKDTSNTIRVRIEISGSLSASMEFVSSNETEFNKIAFKWKTNDFALWVNGVEVATDSSGVSFTANTLDKLSFDRNGGLKFNGKVKQLQIFKTALTDPELVTLTTI